MPNAILDPTGTVTSSAKPAAPRAPRLASLQGKRVGLLINTKRNARPFLEEVGRLLQERYDVTLTERTKVNFAVPEPEDVIKELAAESDVIITGVGDCGSCSAAAAAPFSVVIAKTAAVSDASVARSFFSAVVITPVPSGFVKSSASPSRAPTFRQTRFGLINPVTA